MRERSASSMVPETWTQCPFLGPFLEGRFFVGQRALTSLLEKGIRAHCPIGKRSDKKPQFAHGLTLISHFFKGEFKDVKKFLMHAIYSSVYVELRFCC